jgi:hypothetical protein
MMSAITWVVLAALAMLIWAAPQEHLRASVDGAERAPGIPSCT